MRSYSKIQAEIVEFELELKQLRKEAAEAQAREIVDAKKRIAELMKESGLTADDILKGRTVNKAEVLALKLSRKPKAKSPPLPPVYENTETQETWSGRGRCPGWLVGKDREQFRIRAAD